MSLMNIGKMLLVTAASLFALFSVKMLSAAEDGAGRSRTMLQVENLSCGACLSNIGAALQEEEGMVGMRANLQKGLVVVEHEQPLGQEKIAELITDLGYPATVVSSNAAASPDSAAGAESQQARDFRAGGGCGGCSTGGCGATASSWRQFYERFFSRKAQ